MELRHDVILDNQTSESTMVLQPIENKISAQKEKRNIIKNILVLSVAFLLLFTAFQSVSNLQSSLNSDEGLGFASLCAIYASLIVSCMFVPPLVIDRLGLKWTVVLSMSFYALYTVANFYSTWYTLIPASILLGFAGAPLWSAKCAYLTTSSMRYSKLSNESQDMVVTRFFGLFFLIFQSGQIWGNLISSLILKPHDTNTTGISNVSVLPLCGAAYCPAASSVESDNLTSAVASNNGPQQSTVITLMSIYLACGILGILVVALFLNRLAVKDGPKKGMCTLFVATLRHLKDKRMMLLIPLTMFSGLEQGFVFGDFTKSFITCSLGVEKVGFIMICFGVTDALFSFALGKLSQYTGRPILMVTGALINGAVLIFLLNWTPYGSNIGVFFGVAALWGFCDAIWQTQVNAFYGFLFHDNQEAAFSNYRLWESIGFVFSFAYANVICIDIKIYILLAALAIGIFLYLGIEYIERKAIHNKDIQKSNLTDSNTKL